MVERFKGDRSWLQSVVLAAVLALGPPAWGSESCTLRTILDGDTVVLDCPSERGMKVRLHCIDAPEMGQKPWGAESRTHLAELIGGRFREKESGLTPASRPRVELERLGLDRFGRVVGELGTGNDGRTLGMRMVVGGRAAVYGNYCADAEYAEAEKIARGARLGIWKREGGHQRPWDWRHRGEGARR